MLGLAALDVVPAKRPRSALGKDLGVPSDKDSTRGLNRSVARPRACRVVYELTLYVVVPTLWVPVPRHTGAGSGDRSP